MVRRTIAELNVRYKLHPHMDDLYVEGSFDRDILSVFLKSIGKSRAIYKIGTVEISPEDLSQQGLTDGEKQRVIFLARKLAEVENGCFQCNVDKDLDQWLCNIEETPRLRYSTYCDLEAHFLSPEVVHEILIDVACCQVDSFDKCYASICLALKELFSFRLVDREFELKIRWVSLKKYLTFHNGCLSFDASRYASALYSSNAVSIDRESFLAKSNEWKTSLAGDPRHQVRGHDYIEILALCISGLQGIREFSNPVIIERMLVALASKISDLAYECV